LAKALGATAVASATWVAAVTAGAAVSRPRLADVWPTSAGSL